MLKNRLLSLALASGFLSPVVHAAPFADAVVSYSPGVGFAAGYTDPSAALGEPSRVTPGMFGGPVDPFDPPYLAAQMVSLGAGGSLTVRFNTPILDSPGHPYGLDFLIFGNAGFDTGPDFNGIANGSLFGHNSGATRVSVSADNVTYYELNPVFAPVVDALFPTDGAGDFQTPVNPLLGAGAFAGQDLAGVRTLYAGSGGGAGFDLAWARDDGGQGVSLASVSFIRIDVLSGKSEIDGLATVVPEPAPEGLLGLGIVLGWAARRRFIVRRNRQHLDASRGLELLTCLRSPGFVLDCGGKRSCSQGEPSKLLFQSPTPLFARTLDWSRSSRAIRKRRRRCAMPAQSKTSRDDLRFMGREHLQNIDVSWGHEPGLPLTRPSGTLSPIGGEGWGEGVRFMGENVKLQRLPIQIVRPTPALALAGLVLLAAASRCGAAVFQEDFSSDPAQRGWRGVGDASLFQWDAAQQNLAVTWDSSHTNSFFLRSLGTVLARSDDFSFSFDVRLSDIRAGSTPGKSNEFEIAIGLLNYRNATSGHAFRGAGASVSNGVRNLVEFDYFPDAGFGDTFATTVISSNNVFAFAHNFPLTLAAGDVFRLTLSYTAADQVLRTSALRNGAPFDALAEVSLAGTPDFRVDTFAVISYSDAIQAGPPTFHGSVLAHGTVDNVELILPPPPLVPVSLRHSNSVWSVEFASETTWSYTLERSADLSGWQPAGAATSGTSAVLGLPDTNAPELKLFYRVRAERP